MAPIAEHSVQDLFNLGFAALISALYPLIFASHPAEIVVGWPSWFVREVSTLMVREGGLDARRP
jgi:hypothetical protein